MTLLVPFDDSPLSRTALKRANDFARFTETELVALTVVPDDLEYAESRGWLTEQTPFTVEAIAARLEEKALELAPNARFRHETIDDEDDPVATTTLNVVRKVREVAAEEDISILFIGSENAGRVVSPQSSVGKPLSEDSTYDIHIVRHAD